MDEVVPNEPYMAETGRSTGLNYGYLFDRFLQKDDFDADGKLKVDAMVNRFCLRCLWVHPVPVIHSLRI